MSGWLGSNFTSQLGHLKNQVSNIAKDVFVVEDEDVGDLVVGEEGKIERVNGSKKDVEMTGEYQTLAQQRSDAVQEKEEQCRTFRELLMEKEEEIAELSRMFEESQQREDKLIKEAKENEWGSSDNEENVSSQIEKQQTEKLLAVLQMAFKPVDKHLTFDELLLSVKTLVETASEISNQEIKDDKDLVSFQQINLLKDELSNCEIRYSKLEDAKSSQDSLVDTLQQQLDSSSTDFNTLEIKYEDLDKLLIDKNESEKNLLNKISDLEETFQSKKKSYEDKFKQEIDNCSKLHGINNDLQNTNDRLKKDIEKLAESHNNEWKLERTEKESLKLENVDLLKKVEELEGLISIKGEQVSTVIVDDRINRELRSAEEKVTEFSKELKKANEELKTNLTCYEQEKLNLAASHNVDLQMERTEKENIIFVNTDLLKKVEDLEESLDDIKKEQLSSVSLDERITEEFKSAERKVSELSKELAMEKERMKNMLLIHEQEKLKLFEDIKTSVTEKVEASMKYEEMAKSLKESESQINKFQHEISLHELLIEQENQNEEKLTAYIDELETSKKQLLDDYSSVQDALSRSVTDKEIIREQFKIEGKNQHRKDLDDVKLSMLNEHQRITVELQKKISSYEANINAQFDLEGEVIALNTKNVSLEEELQTAKLLNIEATQKDKALQEQLINMEVKAADLAEEVNQFNKGKDILENEVQSLRNERHQLESTNGNLRDQINSQGIEFQQAQKNMASLEDKTISAVHELELAKGREVDLNEALDSLKSINEMITKSARDKDYQRKGTEAILEEMKDEKDSLGKCVEDLEMKLQETLTQCQLEIQQKKDLETSYSETQALVSSLKNEVKSLSLAKESRIDNEKDIDEAEHTTIDKNMIQVLNEKIRENSNLKNETSSLMENLSSERFAKEKVENELAEIKQTYSSMNTETVKKLSILIKEKDLEIESMTERNKSLLEVLENEKGKESVSNENEFEKQRLLEEIVKLKESNTKNKDNVDNSNELIYLKGKILELERKLYHSESEENKIEDLEKSSLNETGLDRSLSLRLETKNLQLSSVEKEVVRLGQELTEMRLQVVDSVEQARVLKDELNEVRGRELEKEQEVDRARKTVSSMQNILDEKTTSNASQQEQSLKHIGECQRLSAELGAMMSERDQALSQAAARLGEAQDLRKEVGSVIDKKRRIEGEVERLRGHLVQVEEGYTQELVDGEEREKELRKRVALLEDKLRTVSVNSSEATESASQASSQLISALEAATSQRDKLADQLATTQATLRERNMALRNLNLALEGFQKQKDNELAAIEQSAQLRVKEGQKVAADLSEKLRVGKVQLDRAQQGLEAAARLSAQLDSKGVVISNLKQELLAREELVKQYQAQVAASSSSQVGKVDKALVKNLVVGYATADDSKKAEVLRIIATVLDFNQDERGRTGLDGGGGWLGGILGRRSRNPSQQTEQSIARAFIQFMEDESSPRAPAPTLPVVEMARNKVEQLAAATVPVSARHSTNPSPLLAPSPGLTLPSLATVPSSNNSPNILKSVLDTE